MPSWLGTVLILAHHILGIPHYAYDENYPQAPVLKLVEDIGDWEFQLTCYPGTPVAGQRSEIHVYACDRVTRRLHPGPLTLRIGETRAVGDQIPVYGPASARPEGNLFKFFPTYPEDGNYELTIAFPDAAGESTLRFPIVVGDPGSPWMVAGGFAGGLALFVVLIRAIRIKVGRRRGDVR